LGRDLMLVRRRPTRQPADRRARGKRWGEAGHAGREARAQRGEGGDRWRDRQVNRHTDRQTDRQTDGRQRDRQTDERDVKERGGLTVTLSRTKGRGGRSGRSAMQCNGEGEGKGEAGGLGEWSSRASSGQGAGR
jgi:hypothetical protein